MNFSQKLQMVMQNKGFSNYKLAKELGVHQTTIRNWLDGKTEPKFEMIDRMADVFQMSLDEFLSDVNALSYNKDLRESTQKAMDMLTLEFQVEKNSTITENQILSKLKEILDEWKSAEKSGQADEFIKKYVVNEEVLLKHFRKLSFSGKHEVIRHVLELSELEEQTHPDDVE